MAVVLKWELLKWERGDTWHKCRKGPIRGWDGLHRGDGTKAGKEGVTVG